MLRRILGVTLKDRKSSDDIGRIVGVACVTDKVREASLRCYTDMCSGEKTTTVPSESWRQMSIDNGAEIDNGKDGSTSSSTIWRSCDSRQWTQRIALNGEGEPV